MKNTSTEAGNWWVRRLTHRRTRFLLLRYRRNSESLEQAWSHVNRVWHRRERMRFPNLTDPAYSDPSEDPCYGSVKGYLDGEPSGGKPNIYVIGCIAGSLLIGSYLLSRSARRFAVGIDSYGWETSEATITHVRFHRQTSKYGDWALQDCKYQFTVEDQPYQGFIMDRRYFDEDEILHQRQSITIYFNPLRPRQSFFQRDMYGRSVGVVISLIVLAPGVLIVSLIGLHALGTRGLRSIDPQ